MTQNINVKKDAKVGLRKAMVPLGIIAAICGLIFIAIHASGIASTDANFQEKMVKVARYFAMPAAFLTLALTALMLTHGIMQLAKLNKTNIKWEITSGIINTIVGILMFVSFIIIIVTVFDNEKWLADGDSFNIWKNCAFMGIMTALAIYAVCLGKHFNAKGLENKNTNIKMLRVIGVSALVIALCNILPILVTVFGGFVNIEKVTETGQVANWAGSSFGAKFALGAFGTIGLGMLCMIPLSILGFNDEQAKKKNIITWSVIGGIAFVLFVIPAAMMSLDHGAPKGWSSPWAQLGEKQNNIVITVFVLLAGIYDIVAGGIANVKTKQFVTKQVKVAK